MQGGQAKGTWKAAKNTEVPDSVMDSGQGCKNAVLKHTMLSACPVPSGEEAAWSQHRQNTYFL